MYTDFAIEKSILIQILLLIGKLNNLNGFYFSLAKVEAKPSRKNVGFESPLYWESSKPNYLLEGRTKNLTYFFDRCRKSRISLLCIVYLR